MYLGQRLTSFIAFYAAAGGEGKENTIDQQFSSRVPWNIRVPLFLELWLIALPFFGACIVLVQLHVAESTA